MKPPLPRRWGPVRVRLLARSAYLLALLTVSCGHDDPRLPLPSVTHDYQFGETVSFLAGGDSKRFCTSGWSRAEPAGTWTEGPAASLAFRVTPPEKGLMLSMTLTGHKHPPHLLQQPVELYVNGEKIGTWVVREAATHTALIPKQIAARGLLIVDLHLPKAFSPAEVGASADPRRLGVYCSELAISHSDMVAAGKTYMLGSIVHFGKDGGSEPYRVRGWSATEAEATWTEQQTAILEFEGLPTGEPLLLRARINGMTNPPALPAQPTDVYVNERPLAQWKVGGEIADFFVAIPAGIVSSGRIRVEFWIPQAVSPKQVGASEDARLLGLRCFELQVSAAP